MDDGVGCPTAEHTGHGNIRRRIAALSVSALYVWVCAALSSRFSATEPPRQLSADLGGGRCRYENPLPTVPTWWDLHKTLVAGYPSGGKRMVFMQMEALTALPTKDEWDFEIYGMTNHPFIKTNYPHHEGIWETYRADQAVLMYRSIRSSLIEYHDIMYDFGYPADFEQARKERQLNIERLYTHAPLEKAFLTWRDERLLFECSWFSWYIDFWMEGGLYRDIFSHRATTAFHWNRVTKPATYTVEERDFDLVVGNATVTPTYDPHCVNGDVVEGCAPKVVISTERLYSDEAGNLETQAIATALQNDAKTGAYVISNRTWTCIWKELVKKKKGGITVFDRPKTSKERNFSAEMLEKMIQELTYLMDKYSAAEWSLDPNARRLVELVAEDRARIRLERDNLRSQRSALSDQDFLGPQERARRQTHLRTGNAASTEADLEFAQVFDKMAARRRWERKKRLFAARNGRERAVSPSFL